MALHFSGHAVTIVAINDTDLISISSRDDLYYALSASIKSMRYRVIDEFRNNLLYRPRITIHHSNARNIQFDAIRFFRQTDIHDQLYLAAAEVRFVEYIHTNAQNINTP